MKVTVLALVLALSMPVVSNSLHATSSLNPSSTTKIDLNKADVSVLSKSIKGIGKKRAEAIVRYRTEHGRFKSLEELAQVRGLGKQFVNKHLKQLQEKFLIN